MKKTIGGDRLGAGGRMTVEMKNYERSSHDLGYLWRSTMAPGTLIPFMVETMLPGDTFDINLNCDVKTHPTLGPLFGSYKVQLDVFECPLRLYHSALMQNPVNVGLNIANILLPAITSPIITASSPLGYNNDPDNVQINPSCILSYLGLRGWGMNHTAGSPTRLMNAVPFIAYWEIYKNYYSNKQENNGVVLTSPTPTAKTISTISVDGNLIPLGGTAPTTFYIGQGSTIIVTFSGASPDLSQVTFNTSNGIIKLSDLATYTFTATTATSQAGSIGVTLLQINGWNYVAPGTTVQLTTFLLTAIDAMKTTIMQAAPVGARVTLTGADAVPYSTPLTFAKSTQTQCGLGIKTYQSDLFNNWMQTAWYTTIQTTSRIDTSSGTFNIDTLILARKVYDLLNRVAISGNTYTDWVNAAYAHEPYTQCISPIYHGGLSKELVFQEVVSNSSTNTQPLGTLAGRGVLSQKHKGGRLRIKSNEHGYLIGIVSITPRIDYSQGNSWQTQVLTLDNFHKPALDQIGFQDLITEQMAWWDTKWNGTTFATRSAGKQPAWVNYMTNVNRTYGNFAVQNNEMFMTLNRRYQMNGANGLIADLTTYIDPTHYNFIFAETNLDAQNFWTQISVDMTARRKMSAKIMPNL